MVIRSYREGYKVKPPPELPPVQMNLDFINKDQWDTSKYALSQKQTRDSSSSRPKIEYPTQHLMQTKENNDRNCEMENGGYTPFITMYVCACTLQ